MRESSPFRVIWDLFIIGIALYKIIYTPYDIAFMVNYWYDLFIGRNIIIYN